MTWRDDSPLGPEPTSAQYRCHDCGLTVPAVYIDNVQSGQRPDGSLGVAAVFATPHCAKDGSELIREAVPAEGPVATGAPPTPPPVST